MPTGMRTNGSWPLSDARRRAADIAFLDYVFGGLTVAETGGWEFTEPGLKYSRSVFFENPTGGDSIHGCFTVVFVAYDSASVYGAYAIVDGHEIGSCATCIAAPSPP